MATPATARTPITRRGPSGSSSRTSPPPQNVTVSAVRGGTSARSAVPSRVSAGPLSTAAKRASRSSPTPSVGSANEVATKPAREALEAALRREAEEKESLLLRLQNQEQAVTATTAENDNLAAALSVAESRLAELYSEQARMEEDMAARVELVEKLRIQVKELEKEKRDALRRYNEQTTTFEAERQAFYDSEQHLKSRIQSLMQARRRSPGPPRSPSIATQDLPGEDTDAQSSVSLANHDRPDSSNSGAADEATEPAEMTALRLELTTLSTSHSSLHNTVHLLQSELNDLKRVNNELQEENESYNILLRERTLSGRFDIMRATGGTTNDDDDDDDGATSTTPAEELQKPLESRPPSMRSRSMLDVVPEAEEMVTTPSPPILREESPSSRNSKRSRRGGPRPGSPVTRGESLADLPVAGPGLDLAAELGRAENKDIMEGHVEPSRSPSHLAPKNEFNEEVQALRSEVKALKDANKALSLYASKILDRILAQEGFEHVLAVDYDPANPKGKPPSPVKPKPTPKSRPLSFFPSRSTPKEPAEKPVVLDTPPTLSRANSISGPVTRTTTTTASPPVAAPPTSNSAPSVPAAESAADKRARRTLSMDWKGITTFFGGGSSSNSASESKTEKLRPLTLKAGVTVPGLHQTSPIGNARKVETVEDENDRRERERMLATMKLMGIEAPAPNTSALGLEMSKSSMERTLDLSSPVVGPATTVTSPPPSTRVPFFTRFRSGDSNSQAPAPQPQASLTTEALEQAEAESTIAALDAKERAMTADYAKGKSGSGFTELGSGRLTDRKRSSAKSASVASGRGRVSLEFGEGDGSSHSRAGSVNTLFSAGTVE
ncbi:hypothetical protein FRB99_007415 [Tulasnella sp. 403]|nr:hypothetical protein FRB99_007415 [Tulasnella sp. 403]